MKENDDEEHPKLLKEEERQYIQEFMGKIAQLVRNIREPIDPRIEGLLVISGQLLEQQLDLDLKFEYTGDGDGDIPSKDDLENWFVDP